MGTFVYTVCVPRGTHKEIEMLEKELQMARNRLRTQLEALTSSEGAYQDAVQRKLIVTQKAIAARLPRQRQAVKDTEAIIAELEVAAGVPKQADIEDQTRRRR